MRELSHRNLQIGGFLVTLIAIIIFYIDSSVFLILTIVGILSLIAFATLFNAHTGAIWSSPTSGSRVGLRSKIRNYLGIGDGKMFQILPIEKNARKKRGMMNNSFNHRQSPRGFSNENRSIDLSRTHSPGPLLSPFLPRAKRIHDRLVPPFEYFWFVSS